MYFSFHKIGTFEKTAPVVTYKKYGARKSVIAKIIKILLCIETTIKQDFFYYHTNIIYSQNDKSVQKMASFNRR